MTVPMRWRTFCAVACLLVQMGSSTAITSAVVIRSTSLLTKLRAGVLAQRRLPVCSRSCRPPSTPHCEWRARWRPPRRRSERRGRGARSARVAAGAGDSAVGEGAFARLGQGHEGEAAEAERAGLSVNDEPLDPVSGSGGLDVQVESVAVAILARLDDTAAEGGREGLVRRGCLSLVFRARSTGVGICY